MSTKKLFKQVLSLSPLEKSQIVEAILRSLDQPDADIEKIWGEEADLRLDAFQRGVTKTVPYEEVF